MEADPATHCELGAASVAYLGAELSSRIFSDTPAVAKGPSRCRDLDSESQRGVALGRFLRSVSL